MYNYVLLVLVVVLQQTNSSSSSRQSDTKGWTALVVSSDNVFRMSKQR
jgi:hypothetical protein